MYQLPWNMAFFFFLWINVATFPTQVTFEEVRSWINNYIHIKLGNVITDPCPNINVSFTKSALKLGHGFVITSHRKLWVWLIIHALYEWAINTLRLRPNGCRFADDVLKCIFLNENIWILIKIPLKFVPMGSINNTPALVQVMAWRRLGDKPLSEPMMVRGLTHICVTRPQWVNLSFNCIFDFLNVQHGGIGMDGWNIIVSFKSTAHLKGRVFFFFLNLHGSH